ncbi:MAG TPA: VacJ family lipoprotein [Candidatus Binatia bacterium]|nr:VacJ family lipoprotein [Candidatus Binatia bacterium]
MRRMGMMCALILALGAPAFAAELEAEQVATEHDPLESFNRKMFWFNDKVDVYVLEPVAKGWNWVAPRRVQTSVSNFFGNLRYPIVTVNDLLQLRPVDASRDAARFAVNTTVGVLGFFDPAARWGMPAHEQDFGQTLAYWRVPSGPYLVLPLLGPSNPRDAVGIGADSVFSIFPWFVDWWILAAGRTGQTVNERTLLLDQVREAKAASLDYYTAVRNGYVQHRRRLLGVAPEAREEIYYPQLEDK